MTNYEFNFFGSILNDAFWHRDTEILIDALDVARRDHFSTDLGKIIYSSVIKVIQSDAVPDIAMVDELLSTNQIYNAFDGRLVISDAVKSVNSPSNAVKYAERVRADYFVRDAKKRLEDAAGLLSSSGAPKEKLEETLNLLSGISTDFDTTKADHSFRQAANEMFDHLEIIANSGSKITGLDTGFARLNEYTHGLQDGNTVVVAGVPGGGKTTFCLNIMAHAAITNKKNVLFYSLEMPKREISTKVCSSLSNIYINKFQNADVVKEDYTSKVLQNTLEKMNGINFNIDDDSSLTAETIENRTKKHAMEMNGIDLICVDYLTLLDAQGESETVRATNAAKALKRLAKKFNCPVIIISQFVKNVVGRPTKADLRQTGQLGQDASLILFLYKNENQIVEHDQKKLIELIIDKNRMGETGDIMLEPQFEFSRMIETDREVAYPLDSDGKPIIQPKGFLKRVN